MKRLKRGALSAALAIAGVLLASLLTALLLVDDQPEPAAPSEERVGATRARIEREGLAAEGSAPDQAASPAPSPAALARPGSASAARPQSGGLAARRRDQRPEGWLRARVLDPRGQPLADARVRLGAGSGRRRGRALTFVTDAVGAFEAALPPGRYALVAQAEGFARSEPAGVRVRSRETSEVSLSLRVSSSLRGRALDLQGQPIASARVQVERGGRAETDAAGRFVISGLVEGLYDVSVEAKGYVRGRARDVAVTEERGGEVELRLEPGALVSGTLLGPDAQPVARGLVFAYRDRRRLGMGRSDAQGRYRLEGLSPGPVELFARSRDYELTARIQGELRARQLTALDLPMAEGPTIVGVLRDRAGAPQEGLELTARDLAGDATRRARSDAEGRYRIEHLYPGRYELQVAAGRRRAALLTEEVEVGVGETQLDLSVPRGARVTGRVLNGAGEPVPEALVAAAVGGDTRVFTQTGPDGAYALEDLPADTYRIFVRKRGEESLLGLSEELSLSAGDLREGLQLIARRPARVRGVVLDGRGQPLAEVSVRARASDAPVTRRGRCDAEGEFELGPCYDGEYRLSVDPDDLRLLAAKRGVAKLVAEPARVEVREGQDQRCTLRVRAE